MKIIAGIARGISLSAPDGYEVRPTSARARKALFDSIGVFSGKIVFDLFAGSGALGLEAASRGAASVVFIDNTQSSCDHIKENILKVQRTGVQCQFTLIHGDVLSDEVYKQFSGKKPDLIFADPPYKRSSSFFSVLAESETFLSLASDAILIWEFPHEQRGEFIAAKKRLTINKFRNYEGLEFLFASIQNIA